MRHTRGQEKVSLRVVQLSDVHISTTSDVDPGARAAVLAAELARLSADLVVVTGDLAEVDPTSEAQAETAHTWGRTLEKVLGVPLLVIPGNHDVGENDVHPEIAPEWRGALVSSELVAAFRRRWGSDRFVYSHAATVLVGVNGQLLGSGLPEELEQEEWLLSQLQDLGAPWVLLCHQPLHLPDGSSPTRHWGLPPRHARDHLWELLRDRRPAAVLSGHIHAYSARHPGGETAQITCPSFSHTVPEE
ncbi:MAG TPA: metallophosphoesterase, partial [Acidimicrobiales bacterium]|nr:metallophosphoesterase [Acidimicrobiales bacterium]